MPSPSSIYATAFQPLTAAELQNSKSQKEARKRQSRKKLQTQPAKSPLMSHMSFESRCVPLCPVVPALCVPSMCVCVCLLCVLVLSAPPSHPARCLEMVSPVAAAVCDLFHLFGLLLILVFVFISFSLSFTHSLSLFVFLFCQSRTQIKLTSCLSIANSKLIRASGQFLAKWLAVSPAQPCLLLVWIPVSPLSLSLFLILLLSSALLVGGQRLQLTLVAPATAVATACSRCLLAPVLDTHRSRNVST